jgi:hypothetical protein
LRPSEAFDPAEIVGSGDAIEISLDDEVESEMSKENELELEDATTSIKPKKASTSAREKYESQEGEETGDVPESWDDDLRTEESELSDDGNYGTIIDENRRLNGSDSAGTGGDVTLAVYRAFFQLKRKFDDKFRAIWA